jgi:uncharacterized membrane protein YeaQ/YmgE (transglycosylase-associated protein family)
MATTTPTNISANEAASQPNSVLSAEVVGKLSEEINSMLIYASRNGIDFSQEMVTLVQDSSVDDMLKAHNLMCKTVAPATPKSINYTRELYSSNTNKSLFAKLPLVRNLIILALVFLCTFVLTALSPEVNNDSLDLGILNNHGLSLLINLGFMASVSGLGVTFYLLKTVSTNLKKGTLIPEDTIYYISLIVLGVIAGLIMSEILSLYTTPQGINLFNKSILALLGGFSSDAIFSVLQSLIEKIKSIFVSDSSK